MNFDYRGENKGLFVLLSRTQAGPGRTVKQEQEEISRNHVQTFISPSVMHSRQSSLRVGIEIRDRLEKSPPEADVSRCGILQTETEPSEPREAREQKWCHSTLSESVEEEYS